MTTENTAPAAPDRSPRNRDGWDGKLRVDKKAVIANPNALSDPESDEDAPPVEQIEADEDLLDDYPPDTDEIDLVHSRISSVPSLHLERFPKTERLCLRQNSIREVEGLSALGATLEDLDLYDNQIAHIKGLDDLTKLQSLDLSFNKIKHIKRVNHLKELKDLYFVQNKIHKIEELDGLTKLRNLELAANRIREIENLDTLKGLEELWLGKNKIAQIQNLSPLVNLKILSIQSNRITKISGLEGLASLEELYISHNLLEEITGLEHTPNLRILDISNNIIPHLTGLAHLTHLSELWASSNALSSFQEVEEQLRDKAELDTVYFEGNPLQTQNPVLYRNKVRLALPQVQQIDATFVRVS